MMPETTPCCISDSGFNRLILSLLNIINTEIVKRINIKGIPQIPPVSNSFLKSGFPETAFITNVSADIVTSTRPALSPSLKNARIKRARGY